VEVVLQIEVDEKEPDDKKYTLLVTVPVVREVTQNLEPSLTALSTNAPDTPSVKPEFITTLSHASTVAIVRTFDREVGEEVPEDTLYPAKTKYLPSDDVVK
jgi:hypothetical protein